MKVSVFVSALNIVLDYGLIFGNLGLPRLEVAGAAVATVIATSVQAVLLVSILMGSRKFRSRYSLLPVQRFRPRRLLGLIKVGGPIGVQWILDMGSWTVFTAFIARLGAVQAAASQIAVALIHVSFMPGNAISTAATTLVGQYLGAGDRPAARRSATNALRIAVLFMGFMGLVFFVARRPLVRIFNPDPAVLHIGADLLIFAAVFQVFDAMFMVSAGILRGAGDTRGPAAIQIGLSWFLFLPLAYLLCHRLNYGARGGWLGASVYIVILGIVVYARYRRSGWSERVLLGETPPRDDLPPPPAPEVIGPPAVGGEV